VPIAVTEEHEDLRRTAQRWLETHCPPSVPRAAAEAPSPPSSSPPSHELPALWEKMAAQGWLGLHVPEHFGGHGFALAELAVVLEELGYVLFPGPLLSTLLVSAALVRRTEKAAGSTDAAAANDVAARLLPGLADGSVTAAVALGATPLEGTVGADGTLTIRGAVRPVLGLPAARLVLVPVAAPGGFVDASWYLLDRDALGDPLVVRALPALDATRSLGVLECPTDGLVVPREHIVRISDEDVRGLAQVLAAAESAGLARWCLETASDYAKVRVQFGRPIGQFQAVKHALADMLVSVEQCAAVAWDAAAAWSEAADASAPSEGDHGSSPEGDHRRRDRDLSARIAGAVALDAAAHCAKQCIQTLGGIGFTWEHDAHLYLKRAMASLQLVAGGDVRSLELEVEALAVAGARRNLAADLPPEAESFRAEIHDVVAAVAAGSDDPSGPVRRAAMAEAGLIMAHWPPPWGRGASPLEQLVIAEELAAAGLHPPHLAVGAWALPTLIAYGTEEQQERWVRPTLLGRLSWCQLFSEPGAGSDLAALSTKATRVEGGYVLNGQKVWTTLAQTADYGICLARTDPDAPKHAGITYFIVDMHTEGIDIRPLRELTGAAMFNEVFFDDVFVPDDCVIGAPGDGWRIGRTTLANERVSMSSGASFGNGVESLIRTVSRGAERGESVPASIEGALGHLIAEAQSVALLGHRATLRTLSGVDPGSGSSVRKLLGVEHEQRVQEMGMALYGADGAVLDGRAQRWEEGFLSTRCLTIAGGTSEVQRNVIAERMLGQPKDPEPGS
jgi:alkylation response protein AidB-like acyl-CoA dehydrogenase